MRTLSIVGGSLAGLRAAEALRRDGFPGRINFIGAEDHLPYDRPPLSKQYLAGDWEVDRLVLTEGDKFAGLELSLYLGCAAVGLDVANRVVRLDDGQEISADAVLIATGARARPLAVAPRPGLHVLRSLDDASALRQALAAGPSRVVVIGAGFIGAEVAATARQRGLDVVMVEAAEAPMIRGLGVELGMVCAEIHREHGVDLRLGTGVDAIVGETKVEGVVLADGTELACDVVVVGIGVIPNTEWLDGSGLTLDDGVVCDDTCLAAPGVAAAGDVCRWPNRRFDEVMRVEHWDNAVEQGTYAARRLLSPTAPDPFTPVPWFWSDQYDRKLQLAGRAGPDDEMRLVDGSVAERRFAAIFRRGDRLIGAFGMNRPRQVMQYRRMISDGASWDDALAHADEGKS